MNKSSLPNIAIHRLFAKARSQIVGHLACLTAEDLYSRFGHVSNTLQLTEYANKINFNRDLVVGAYYREVLVGLVHISVFQAQTWPVAELDITVDPYFQGKGLGRELFKVAMEWVKRKHVQRIYIHYLRKNGKMAALCKTTDGYVESDGDETTCCVSFSIPDEHIPCTIKMVGNIETYHKVVPGSDKTILFVHGVAGDAWQWREQFMPYFSRQGYSSIAFSLQGHGQSKGEIGTLREYEENLQKVVEHYGIMPHAVVGHSMGGFLSQRYVEKNSVEKLALITSIPPWGLINSVFSNVHEHMQDPVGQEIVAMAKEGRLPLVNPDNITSDVLVVGGSLDRVVPPSTVEETAKAYGVEPHIVEEAGHLLINGSKWEQIAEMVANHLRV